MQIESIEIKNYRLFRDTKLQNIPRLCVLVGANGTGKSTLFDVFSFLKDALAMNVGKAVSKRGGYKELASRGFADQPIEIMLQFRLEITGYERLVTYILKIEPDATVEHREEPDLLSPRRAHLRPKSHIVHTMPSVTPSVKGRIPT